MTNPRLLPREDPYAAYRCTCDHLSSQHGPAYHDRSRDGCWWCDDCPAFALAVAS